MSSSIKMSISYRKFLFAVVTYLSEATAWRVWHYRYCS